jgi:DDE superfamily endonuclease
MLKYNELKTKPREFLASTGLKRDEFEQLLPAFRAAYEKKSPPDLTQEGTPRQRQFGGGAKGALPEIEDKLFFILVYHKTHPLQTMHGLQCGMSQPQAHFWIHRLLPILQQTLRDLGEAPERDARRVAVSPLALAGGPHLQVDGTERRRQRPKDDTQQKAH